MSYHYYMLYQSCLRSIFKTYTGICKKRLSSENWGKKQGSCYTIANIIKLYKSAKDKLLMEKIFNTKRVSLI